jgi:hypothetical protein
MYILRLLCQATETFSSKEHVDEWLSREFRRNHKPVRRKSLEFTSCTVDAVNMFCPGMVSAPAGLFCGLAIEQKVDQITTPVARWFVP